MKRLSLCVLVTVCAGALLRAEEPQLGPHLGVLLLRNGSVLEGKILRSGDRYDVVLESAELRVRASDVEFEGRTLEECYEHRRQGVEFGRIDDHLQLAEWCLQHKLFAAAGQELRDALACDPSHPKIDLIERRLQLAVEGPPEARPTEPAKLDTATPAELDRMIRSMPSGTVETFTNTIQPMLLNHCSTASCHGPATTTSLKLMRVAGRMQSRRATQRNLHAVLGAINIEEPDASPLLTLPARSHGASRTPVFSSKQSFQYKQLVDWVYNVANKKRAAHTTEETPAEEWPVEENDSKAKHLADGKKPLAQSPTIAAKFLGGVDPTSPKGQTGRAKSLEPVTPASASEPLDDITPDAETNDPFPPTKTDKDLPTAGTANRSERLGRRHQPGEKPARSTPKRGESSKEKMPVDEFDPDEFNRKFQGG